MTVKPPPKNKNEISRDRSIALIKEATTEIFVSRGYQNCHIQGIAQHLGMTKGAVYHYFASKDAIIQAILDDIAASLFEAVPPVPSEPVSATRRLVSFLNGQADFATRQPRAFSMLVLCSIGAGNGEAPVTQAARELFDRLEIIIRDILADGVRAGEFTAELDPEALSRSIVGAYTGNVVSWQRSGYDPRTGRALVRELRSMIVTRIRKGETEALPPESL